MGFIRTLLGDIRPEEMGFTLSHEHLGMPSAILGVEK